MVHCTLSKGKTGSVVRHRTVDEIWYILEGEGEVWRKYEEQEEVIKAETGVCLTIPQGTKFQFRNIGDEPLRFIIVTMPPWPGDDEAVEVNNFWKIDI